MNILNEVVIHKKLGKGLVVEQAENHIQVKFVNKTCKFQYPEVFRDFLVLEDKDNNAIIAQEIKCIDDAKKEEKIHQEKLRELEEKRKLDELASKSNKKNTINAIGNIKREEGINMSFLVFQGNTFDAEYRGGFIWAPKYNQGGGKCHHWERLLNVRKGDIIIHSADRYIKAVSVAQGSCYDAESPRELLREQLWAKEGRMIECEYTKLNEPIKHAEYKDTIKKYSNAKYSPFDKDGNGNMGYLFELNRELAKFFIKKAIEKNEYLLELKYIQEFLM